MVENLVGAKIMYASRERKKGKHPYYELMSLGAKCVRILPGYENKQDTILGLGWYK